MGSWSRARWAAIAIWAAAAAACVDVPDGVEGRIPDLGPDGGTPRIDFGVPPSDPEAPPILRNLTPAEGSVEGGTRVLLRGDALQEPVEVFFGDAPAAQVEQLDVFGVEAVTPPGELGPVDVRITTPTGTSSLADAFTYVPVFEIDRVSPARIPEEGGVEVQVEGRGFTEDTLILFDRKPLGALERLGPERMRGIAPPLAPGRPRVEGVTALSRAVRRDLVTVFATPELERVVPATGPANAPAVVQLLGSGFQDVEEVRFGGQVAPFVSGPQPRGQLGRRLEVELPPLGAGPVEVRITTADRSVRYPGAYFASSAAAGLSVQGLVPESGQAGQPVSVVGSGFGPQTQVEFAGVVAPVLERTSEALRVQVPAGLAPGPVDVTALDGADAATRPDGFNVLPPLRIDGIDPIEGPAAGRTEVTIRGAGFGDDVVFRLDGIEVEDLQVVSETEVRATVLGTSRGSADLVATREFTAGGERALEPARARLEDAFFFTAPFEVLRIHPDDGAFSGGTFVTIYGRGLEADPAVDFGGVAASQVQLENGHLLAVRTPQNRTGAVEVTMTGPQGSPVRVGSFEYFDPRVTQGGGFGGEIDGDLNVSVVDGERAPVEGAVVQVGLLPESDAVALTDANGIATFSRPGFEGPVTVTAGAPGSAFVTMVDYDTRNLTVPSPAFPQPPPPDAPINPCPAPTEFPIVRGRVFGLKSELDPNRDPDRVPVVTVTYSEPGPFSPNPPMPPGQFTNVLEDGESFEIVTARAGTVAVYALLEEVNVNNPNDRRPVRLGIARSVPVAFGQVTEDVVIDVNIDLDQTFDIRLDEPPRQFPGPSVNAVFPFLNLESDGVIPFPVQFGELEVVTLTNMPQLAQSEFIYLAGSFTLAGQGLTAPYSLSLETSVATVVGDEADLGPYLATPVNLTPKQGQVLDDRIRWELGDGVTPDLTQATFGDAIGVTSRCCLDQNENGSCEDDEPVNASSSFAPFTRWSFFAPGGRTDLPVPVLPAGTSPLAPPGDGVTDGPRQLQLTLQQALAPRFTFEEFVWFQFSPLFWESWTLVTGIFSVKEVTD